MDRGSVLGDLRRRAKVLAVVYLSMQWVALNGCSESLSSLQGFAGPLMGIFKGVAGVASFDKYDTSDANFAQNRAAWGQVAGGLRSAGAEMNRRDAARDNLENIPGEVEGKKGELQEADTKLEAAKDELEGLEDTPENAARRAELEQEIDDWNAHRGRLQGEISDLETLWRQSGDALGQDVVTHSDREKYEEDKARAERIAARTDDPDDTWEDHMPAKTNDTSGGSSSFSDRMRQVGSNPGFFRDVMAAAGS